MLLSCSKDSFFHIGVCILSDGQFSVQTVAAGTSTVFILISALYQPACIVASKGLTHDCHCSTSISTQWKMTGVTYSKLNIPNSMGDITATAVHIHITILPSHVL
jgi:hypothetical protein